MTEVISNNEGTITKVSDGETYSEVKFLANGGVCINAGKIEIRNAE